MIEYENLRQVNEQFDQEYKNVFAKTLDRGWFILGKNVENFEQEFASYLGAPHCVGVASGLDALLLPLKAFDFPKNSEVIVPSNTYIATILSILHAGLKPVMVEPDLATYNIDPSKIEAKITANTKALMIVHLYGKSCDMGPILKICKKHNLQLIEDCAQSHGAAYQGKKTGTFGVGAFSFYPTKNLGALGDAGGLVTHNPALAEKFRMYRNYGSKVKYYNEVTGYNSRLDELQAGFLSEKLKRLDEINRHKRELAELYFDLLTTEVVKPDRHADFFDVFHIFNIRTPKRDSLREFLLKEDVKTEVHYPIAPHRQKAMSEVFEGQEFPISDEIHQTTLSLPISTIHSKNDIEIVVNAVNRFFK